MHRRLVVALLGALVLLGQAAAPPPPITLTPNSGAPGATLDITVSAALPPNGQVSFEPAGLLATNLRLNAQRQLQFTLQIPPSAAPGSYAFVYQPTGLTVTAPSALRVPNAFTVLQPPPPPPKQVLVRSIAPVQIVAGDPAITVQISGTGFGAGAQVTFTGTELTATNSQVNRTGDTITATVAATSAATPGARSVIVVNRDQSSNLTQSPPVEITVLASRSAEPLIRQIDPSTFTAGVANVPVRITGSGFEAGARLDASGTGAGFTNVSVLGAGEILALFSADAAAAPGLRSVRITNADGISNAKQTPPPQITIVAARPQQYPPPLIRSVKPDTIEIGGPSVMLQISGANLQTGTKIAISGVVANVVQAAPDGGSLVVQATAGPDAKPGQYLILATNPDGQNNAAQQPPVAVTLTQRQPAPPPVTPQQPPSVRAVKPDSMPIDGSMTIEITGSSFKPGAKVEISATKPAVLSVSPDGGTIVAQIAPAGEKPGSYPVIVTNPDGLSNAHQQPPVLFRFVKPPPEIRQISPSAFVAGQQNVPVTITGSGFESGAQLMLPSREASFSNVVVIDATRIQATLTSLPTATPGGRAVTVRNPDGASNEKQSPPPLIFLEPPTPAAKPVVVHSVTPSQMEIGGPAAIVQVKGEEFAQGAKLAINGVETTVVSVGADGKSLVAQTKLGRAAEPGSQPVVVVNPDGTSNAAQKPPVLFTIALGNPEIHQITPSRFTFGQWAAPVSITGINFAKGATLNAGGGVTVGDVNVVSRTQIQAKISVAKDAAAGMRTVAIANPDGKNNSKQVPPAQIAIEGAKPVTPTPTPTPQPPKPKPEPPKPPPDTTKPIIPPTEILLGPRIDLVTPGTLQPGGNYKLELQGKNLSNDTKIGFGKDLTIVGVPFVTSPTTATVQVIVSAAAPPGAIPASATNPKGSNTGPGGVYIGAKKTAPPKSSKPPDAPKAPVAKKKYKQPTGTIILDHPCDPDLLLSPTACKEPVTLNDATVFVWHELNPGIAKVFVFEIVDGDDKVLFAAQTPKTYYRLSAANLASLPRIESRPSTKKIPKQPAKAKTTSAGKAGASAKTPSKSMEFAYASSSPMKIKPGDTVALTAAMKTAGAGGVKDGVMKAVKADREPEAGEVYWRVRGLANKIDENTGMKLSEIVEVEDSAERPIVLPLPPNGFSCDSGTTNTKIGAFVPEFFPTKYTYTKRPKPCPGDSMNICGLADYAVFSPDARLDVTRVPFDIQQIGDLNDSEEVVFQNLFIDWGDGSEPKPLEVKGKLAKGTQNLKSLKLIRPGGDDNQRLKHMYVNSNPDAEFAMYKVRIFALADPDKTPPHNVSGATKTMVKPVGSLSTLGFGSQSASAKSPSGATAATPQAAAAAAPPAATADASKAMVDLSPKMFTLACVDVQVWNPWGAGADEPLHLLTADVIFPTDSEETKSLIKSAKEKGGAKATAEKAPDKVAPTKAVAQPKTGVKSPLPADVLGLPKQPIPEISDCSSAFKAAVRLTYWGMGRVKLFWYLDGVLLETTALPNMLPPVSTADGEAGKKPFVVAMTSVLPAVLQAAPHQLSVRAEVVKPMMPLIGAKMLEAPSGGPTVKGGTPKGSTPKSGAPMVVSLGATQYSGAKVNQTISAGKSGAFASPGAITSPVFNIIAVEPEPGSEAESPHRFYQVVDHKLKGLPCTIRYATTQTGTFEISDLSTLTRSGEMYSGSGILKLYFPSYDGDVNSLQPVNIAFTGWQLDPAEGEEEDVLVVKSGALEKSVDSSLIALNFPVKLQKISLTSERLALNGSVSVNVGMGFINETTDALPKWEFDTAKLTADGDFQFKKTKDVATDLGASNFEMKMKSAEIDFSRTAGGPPTQPCGTPAADATWQGIRVDGVLEAPDTLQFNNIALLKNYSFTAWGIGPAGLSVKFDDPEYAKSVSTSGVKVVAKGFKFNHCGGTFGSPSFGVEITNAPLIIQTIKGTLTLDEYAELHPSFGPINVEHDWGNVKGKISAVTFGYSAAVANFALTIKSHFWFKALGKPSYDSDYDGVLITLAGNVYGPGGDHYFPVPAAATASIGGYPMQVTALGVGNSDAGDIWFGFKGDVEAGVNAPQAKDREAKFLLMKTASAALSFDDPYQIASLDRMAYSTSTLEYDQFGYSSSDENGVTVQDIHLDFAFPPSSKTVTVKADCHFEESEGRFYFIGTGTVTVADSFGIDIAALFGREASDSYWMVKASLEMPTMIALGSTGFGLGAIHGGLGYSIPINAYDMADLKLVKSDKSGSYSFAAGVDIGTLDEFTIYCRGQLTVKMGGPDAGFRISVGAWILTATHELPFLAEACIQYAGGSFDAGAAMHMELAGGILVIDAPKKGPDTCKDAAINIHFGGSEDWHIWLGQKTLPLTAKLLIIQGKGYLMIDGSGIEMFNGITVDEYWDVEIIGLTAYLSLEGGVEMYGLLKFDPFFIKGSLKGWVDIEAGVDGCCSVGFGANLGFSAEAPPVKVCGHVGVHIGTPWPFPDIDANVGPVCVGG